jgi:hypothetical protein
MMKACLYAAASALVILALPPSAAAKLIDQSAAGFTTAHTARVAATPDDAWKILRMPQKWWQADHSWSGNAENLWMDAQAGGCFCEKMPGADGAMATLGSVQHARIVFAKPGELLRLSGALGPLQGEAVTGTLTIQIKPTEGGSLIRFDYVVGGYMRFKTDEIAPLVDRVIGQQVAGLAKALGGALPPEEKPSPADTPAEPAASSTGLEAAAKALEEGAEAEDKARAPAEAPPGR